MLLLLIGMLDVAVAENDLLSTYRLAQQSDPIFQQSLVRVEIAREERPQALSALLPDLSVNGYGRRQRQESSSSVGFGNIPANSTQDFNVYGYTLKLTQPVYNRFRRLALGIADRNILAAQAELKVAEQELMLRVIERYFDVLSRYDNLRFARVQKTSLGQQYFQAEKNYQVGMTAITDLQEARAGYDRAIADEISAQNELEDSLDALQELTGAPVAEPLLGLDREIPLLRPQPDDVDQWINAGLEQNPALLAIKHTLETAQQRIAQEQSRHYPQVSLVGQYGSNTSGGRFGEFTSEDGIIGMELSLPLFQGGSVRSSVRQARAEYRLTKHQLEQRQREVERAARKAFLGVISGISQVDAFQQAVISSETALQSTRQSFLVGSRIAIDVVAAERETLSARREYANALYEYVIETFRLRQAAGNLAMNDLEYVNSYLTEEISLEIEETEAESLPSLEQLR